MRFRLAITICTLVALLCSCKGESASPIVRRPSYDEYMKNERAAAPSHSLDELEQCPKPNGIFDNLEVGGKGGPGLSKYFSVPGFQIPENSYPSNWPKGKVVEISSSPIAILGGMKNGLRQVYFAPSSERFTLELRPLKSNKFLIGVKGTSGLSGEAEGYLNLSGERKRCENGVLKAFWRKYDQIVPGWELYVEPETGDVVMVYSTAKERGEISYRFKRIGK